MSTTPPPAYDTEPVGNFLGLYLEEDLGLKATLSGLTVTDLNAQARSPRPVPVWFLNPEREERRITYPSITINFLDERVAHEREHRGFVSIGYHYLQDIPFDDAYPPRMEFPIPMDLDYQVTVHARINQHISQMGAALAFGPLHPRFATVLCPGGTIRRLEVLAMTTSNGQEGDKRIFRRIYRVRIPTEIEAKVAIGTRVSQVVLSIFDIVSQTLVFGHREVTRTQGQDLDLGLTPGGQYQSQTAGD